MTSQFFVRKAEWLNVDNLLDVECFCREEFRKWSCWLTSTRPLDRLHSKTGWSTPMSRNPRRQPCYSQWDSNPAPWVLNVSENNHLSWHQLTCIAFIFYFFQKSINLTYCNFSWDLFNVIAIRALYACELIRGTVLQLSTEYSVWLILEHKPRYCGCS